MFKTIVMLIIILVIFSGAIGAQIFWSKRVNKYLGLILPIGWFASSVIIVFSLAKYTATIGGGLVGLIVSCLGIFNIPTIVFMIIYTYYREKNNLEKEMDRMHIQDLE